MDQINKQEHQELIQASLNQIQYQEIIDFNTDLVFKQLDSLLFSIQQGYLEIAGKNQIPYGTAGFREKAHLLYLVSFRVGIFLGFYSKLNTLKVLGVQLSASHNPYEDNGLKITNWEGGMLDSNLEKSVQDFCNLETIKSGLDDLEQKFPQIMNPNLQGKVFLGWDTRPSCQLLKSLIKAGIKYTGSIVQEIGEVTTPQLHFSVWANNVQNEDFSDDSEAITTYYIDYFIEQFEKLNQKPKIPLFIVMDCSEGIGAKWMKIMSLKLKDYFELKTINDSCQDPTLLNNHCGSEFTQKIKQFPKGLKETLLQGEDTICVSIDGDADRIVYLQLTHIDFSIATKKSDDITLIDGDRFSCLFAMVVKKMLDTIQDSIKQLNKDMPDFFFVNNIKQWTIGIVQTAYANGASTHFMKEQLQIEACYEPTGVKFVHKKAHEFDIGIYFEANGHGTILKSKKLQENLTTMIHALQSVTEYFKAAQSLYDQFSMLDAFLNLANQAVGDSISNFLLTQTALRYLQMTPQQWADLYVDYPSRTTKVIVKHKEVVKTNYSEDRVIEPQAIQVQINECLIHCGDKYRCFIRASGTEDVIRVYAEGPDETQVLVLIKNVETIIKENELLN